jgi:Peptidase family M1 domain/Peptidase M1 N-terminal domain/Secretion system C-terminal sorting domain
MKNLFFLFSLIFPTFMVAQPVLNNCQEMHRKFQSFTGKTSQTQVTDYNVTHYNLHVDTINFGQQELRCHVGVTVVAVTAAVSTVELDLLGFNIDSIVCNGYTVMHNYNDTTISIQLSPAISQGDSGEIWVYYQGTPEQDASGWGGFYFSGSYAFNLGVGFMADPHNFGRAWFPCVDNFVSRSSYDFYIRTAATSKAFCNGTLQQSVINPDGTVTWHWSQTQTIPTYLASMAVAPYYSLQRVSNGIPVEWAAMAVDTNNVLATFANLDTILYTYINSYGAYPFDKVGYCLIPFNSGAMEHASSIHIGRAFVNGSQTYATLWAHELSHMWWGDKVTCESAEEMWLNEGFASFNEALYTQVVNGDVAYRDWIRSNHRKVLQFAHTPAQDGSYLTMNAIPHDYTYGFHVYQKGADVVHTLRNYMGDTAFFNGSQAYMNNYAYSHANSGNLRDELTASSGINMTRFFDDWIFTPGFPHFSIDSVVYFPGGLDHYYIYTRQRSKGNNHLYEMPIEITFTNGVTDTTVRVVIDSATNVFHIPIYFYALAIYLDRDGKVSDARVSNEKVISATGVQTLPETNVSLNVISLTQPPLNCFIRAEHNFVAPDPFINTNPGIRLSDYHYWKMDGYIVPNHIKGTFVYDGSTSGTTGYLDNTFITGNEDSLCILYRPGAGFNWEVVGSFVHNIGPSNTDKRGSFTVDTLLLGEYTIGLYDYTVGLHELFADTDQLLVVSPNPSQDSFTITLPDEPTKSFTMAVYDMGGRIVNEEVILAGTSSVIWNGENNPSGVYHVVLKSEGRNFAGARLLLAR